MISAPASFTCLAASVEVSELLEATFVIWAGGSGVLGSTLF